MGNNKKYRYIWCGGCYIDDKISNYRLISSKTNSCIQVEIPDDMELNKYSCDSYSTTYDERLIKDLNPQAIIYVNNRYEIHNELLEYKVCEWWKFKDKYKDVLGELYKKYRNRNTNFDKYTSEEYINYLEFILKNKYILNENILNDINNGGRVHFVVENITGKKICNAKVIDINNNSITIQPAGCKENSTFNVGDELYIRKGYI